MKETAPSTLPSSLWARAAATALGALAVAVGAHLEVALPGAAAPQTAQTLAVLLAGCVLGPAWGLASVVVYLAAGAVGLPVFADGKSGAAVLTGPTAGYLAGFAVAAWTAGIWTRSRLGRRAAGALAGMLLAHFVILALGWLRLALAIGPARAFEAGVAPFLVGAAVKSALAAVVCVAISRRTALDADQ